MPNAVSALQGKTYAGFATVTEAGLQGMITLRGDLSSAKVKKAVKAAAGVDVPAPRRIALKDGKGAGWMSPDELLILVPYAEARATVELDGTWTTVSLHLDGQALDLRGGVRRRVRRDDIRAATLDGSIVRVSTSDGDLLLDRREQIAQGCGRQTKPVLLSHDRYRSISVFNAINSGK